MTIKEELIQFFEEIETILEEQKNINKTIHKFDIEMFLLWRLGKGGRMSQITEDGDN